jgi:membrane protein DedA with SNARE-associated domain
MDLTPLLNWVSQNGPPALSVLLMLGIVGLPVPDETLLVFSGYLIFKGTFQPVTIWLAALAGSIGGITISYLLGRTLGLKVLHRYGRRFGVTEERLHKVHDWLHGVGHWGLTFGYFLPGVRHFTALVAGSSELEYPVFAAFAYSGAILWVSTFLALGYFLGDGWQRASEHVHEVALAALAIVILAVVAYLFWRRHRPTTSPKT